MGWKTRMIERAQEEAPSKTNVSNTHLHSGVPLGGGTTAMNTVQGVLKGPEEFAADDTPPNQPRCPHCNGLNRVSMKNMKQAILKQVGYSDPYGNPGNNVNVNELTAIYNYMLSLTKPPEVNRTCL